MGVIYDTNDYVDYVGYHRNYDGQADHVWVRVKNPKEKAGFILFNHLAGKHGGPFPKEFTIKEIQKELKECYNLDLTEEELMEYMEKYMENNMVMRGLIGYTWHGLL